MTDLKENYGKLCQESIIKILDGDTQFDYLTFSNSGNFVPVSLPYLRGIDMFEIAVKFGFEKKENCSGGISKRRCDYLKDLLDFCIDNDKAGELLSFLFSKGQFVDKLKHLNREEIDSAHSYIVSHIIDEINNILYFSGFELKQEKDIYKVVKIGETIIADIPSIKEIDSDYIKDISERALGDILKEDFDSAITKSRTLLEEVFIYVIEKKNEEPSDSGDIKKLYAQVKDLYNMHANKEMDKRFNELLSGLEKIVNSVAAMRNKNSDAHGAGSKRIKIYDYHTRLIVNSAMTMADFILSVSKQQLHG